MAVPPLLQARPVSIHASVMEATGAARLELPIPLVSIHASVMEATARRRA